MNYAKHDSKEQTNKRESDIQTHRSKKIIENAMKMDNKFHCN